MIYFEKENEWMLYSRKWICWYFNRSKERYALPVSTSFNFKQYRGRNCRAICFFSPPSVRFTSSFIEFFVTVQRTLCTRNHIDRGRWDAKSPVPIIIRRFFKSEKRERESGRMHRAWKLTTNSYNDGSHQYSNELLLGIIICGRDYNCDE